MSVLHIRDKTTGKFIPIKTIKGEKGDTGAVDGLDYYDKSPLALGNAAPGTSNLVARGDHVHPMPSASDVGARPATWTPTAEDVGARPAEWMPTAEDVGARPAEWMPNANDVGAATFTLLWENASKTSSFKAQTLSLGLTGYDLYMVIARYSTSIGGTSNTFAKTGYSARLMGVGASSSPTESIRTITYSAGSLSVGDAQKNGSTDNTMLIPILVYGIKGVNEE